MKADDRIVELLAKHPHKTDRLLERMEKTDKNIDIMSKAILEQNSKFNEINQRQEAVLKEILSISKRVSNLENKD